jgi:hypothetical protein
MNTPTRPVPAKRASSPPTRPTVVASSQNIFEDLIDDKPKHGRFLMLYSPPGMGKTTLAAQFPKPMFITTSGEQGIYLYKERKLVPSDIPIVQLEPLFAHEDIPAASGHPGYNRCMSAMTRFRDGQHDRETLVIDSTSGLQDICYQHCASVLFDGDMDSKDFTAYYAGYTKAAEAFWSSKLLATMLEIVAKGYNVVLIAHSTFKPVNNPNGPDYDQYRPELDKNIWKYTSKDLHGVFFLGQEIMVSIDQKTKKKNTVGDRRFIGLSPTTYYTAKSWCTPEGMNEIDCGESAKETWSKLKEALGM